MKSIEHGKSPEAERIKRKVHSNETITADPLPTPYGIGLSNLSFFFRLVVFGVASTEFLDAAGGIYQLLFAGKERMAGGANLHLQLGQYRAYLESAAAGTYRGDSLVFRMYIFFHGTGDPPNAG